VFERFRLDTQPPFPYTQFTRRQLLSFRYLEAIQGMKETTVDFYYLSTHQLIMKGDGYVRRYVSRDGRF